MGIQSLLGQVTDEQLKALPSRTRSPERVQQSLDAFALHLQGVSDRGVQQHFGWKSLSTAQNSIKRGEELAKKLSLDTEKIRLKLAAAFDYLADVVVQQVKEQVENGREVFEVDARGNKSMKRMKGVDPRMLGEAGRGLTRFAEFAGLLDRQPEVNQQVVSMVNLAAPSDGGTFAEKWGNAPAETVDVQPMSIESSSDANNAAIAATGQSLQTEDPCDVEHPAADAATAKDGDQ